MYDNFDILITEDRVLITGSEQGVQAPGTADLVNEIRKLQGNLDMIAENQVDAQLLDEFGTQLADVLFRDNVQDCFHKSLAFAQGRRHGLRVRLQAQADSIQSIPWEFMKVGRLNQPFAISSEVTLSRYPVISQWIEPLWITPPMRILVMISNPNGDLDVDKEWYSILQATKPLCDNGRIQVDLVDATRDKLRNKLTEPGGYHVFHFIGHGGFDGGKGESFLVFEDGLVDATTFSTFFLGNDAVRLIILNACETAMTAVSVAQKLTMLGVPAVIAMQHKITDGAAIIFAENFYKALVRDATLDAAVNAGRRAIFNGIGRHVRDWGIPVLFTRSGDGRVIRFETIDIERQRRELVETLMEWKDLHNFLQNIDTSFGTVRSEARRPEPSIEQMSAYWDSCKKFIAQLTNFAQNIKHIGTPYEERQSGETFGEPWVVELVMKGKDISRVFQSDLNDKQEQIRNLKELTSKFDDAVSRHLVEADNKLREVARELLKPVQQAGGRNHGENQL